MNFLKYIIAYFRPERIPYKTRIPNISMLYDLREELDNLLGGYYLDAVQKALLSGQPQDLARAQEAYFIYEETRRILRHHHENIQTRKAKAGQEKNL